MVIIRCILCFMSFVYLVCFHYCMLYNRKRRSLKLHPISVCNAEYSHSCDVLNINGNRIKAMTWAWLSVHMVFHSTWWRHQIETFSALLDICAGNSPVPGEINGWVNNREAGDLRHHRAHYDVIVIFFSSGGSLWRGVTDAVWLQVCDHQWPGTMYLLPWLPTCPKLHNYLWG